MLFLYFVIAFLSIILIFLIYRLISSTYYIGEQYDSDNKNKTSTLSDSSNNKYVSCEYLGGLGNQLFCIYTAISYGLNNKKSPVFIYKDSTSGRKTYFDNLLKNVNMYKEIDIKWENIYENGNGTYTVDDSFKHKNIMFNGYLQSYHNFIDNIDIINNMLDIASQKDLIKKKYSDLVDTNMVAIHFRLGDYKHLSHVHDILPDNYYSKALDHIKTDNKKILVFCEKEDYEEVEKKMNNILKNTQNSKFKIVKNIEIDYEEMLLISLCSYIICANSTFSFWAGVLSGHKNVYIPLFKWYSNSKDRYLLPGWTLIEY